jgi:hypothetical protein
MTYMQKQMVNEFERYPRCYLDTANCFLPTLMAEWAMGDVYCTPEEEDVYFDSAIVVQDYLIKKGVVNE